ncbi:MAG TPA: AarF/ABC1/UbiB kinase family protein, partial [Smithellaceae bacterium]|nr:AarF/ABC1/UbiB kinase family protein [Smithellaceae bacterium]
MQIYKIGIGRTYRHIQRYRQILSVLFRHGFGDVVDTLKIEQYLDIGLNIISRKSRDNVEALSRADRIRMAIEELGPTFIKVGQILSTRPDLLPMDLVTELGKLQDSVPPFEFASVKNILEEELKVPLSEIFSEFDETPLASASIGQVHRASLVGGDDVVVKIQRPGIRKTVEVDLEIMLHLATLMEKHFKDMEVHKPTQIVEEFARTLDKEMDYGMEAANLEQFAAQAGDDHCVYVPRVYREASTGKILTMEFIDGIKASQIGELEKEGLDRKEIARRGFDLILKQIFIHGFFHADPHPGNLFILPDNVICFLDFGMMGRIGRISREHFADLLMSIVSRDEEKAVHALLKLTVSDQESNRQSLERDMADLINSYAYRPLKEIDLEKFLQQMLDMMAKHRLTIPADLFLMIKSLSTVEGLGLSLDPEFDAIAQ